MADDFIIKIGVQSDTSGATRTEKAFGQVKQELKESTAAADQFVAALKAGVGIDLGGKLVTAVAAIPDILRQAATEGVAFNAQLESAQLGIAAIFKQFGGQKFGSFDAAVGEAGKAVDALKGKAATTNATFSALLGTYQATVGTLFAANITDISEQVDLVGLLANAVSSVISDQSQLIQETKAILSGNITSDATAAQTFGITPQDIASAKEAGKLADFLKGKLGAFAEAGERGAKTYSVALGNLEESIKSLEAELSKPLFEALRAGILALDQEIQKPETVEALKALGFEFAQAAKSGVQLVELAIKHAAALSAVAHVAGVVGVAFAAMGIAQLVISLGQKSAAWLVSARAIDTETAALARNTAAQVGNASAAQIAGGSRGVGAVVRGSTSIAEEAALARTATARAAMTGGAYRATGGAVAAGAGIGAASVVIGVIGLAAAGIAIGSWIDGVVQNARAKATEANKLTLKGKDAKDEITSLTGRAFSADSGNRGEVEAAIAAAREDTKSRLGTAVQTGDTQLESLSRMRLQHLKEIYNILEKSVVSNDAQIAQEAALAKEEEARAKKAEKGRVAAMGAEQWKATAESLDEAWQKILAMSDNGVERLSGLDSANALARGRYKELADKTVPGGVDSQGNAKELLGAAGRAVDPVSELQLAKLAGEIFALEAQITQEKQRQREETSAQAEESRKVMVADEKERETRNQALEDIATEHEIQTALVDGHTALARELERQRDMRKEIAALMEKGLGLEEATAAAAASARLERLKDLREESRKRESGKADLELSQAQASGSKSRIRKAEDRKTFLEAREKFKGDDFTDEEADQMAQAQVAAQRRIQRKKDHTIGGPTQRSSRDTLGDGMGIGGSTFSGLDSFAALQRTPFGEQVKTSSPAAAAKAGAAAGDSAAGQMVTAAEKQTSASGDIGKAAAAMASAATAMSANAATLLAAVQGLAQTQEAQGKQLTALTAQAARGQ